MRHYPVATLREQAAAYDPSGWWVGWAGPYATREEAEQYAAVAGGTPYLVDREGLPV